MPLYITIYKIYRRLLKMNYGTLEEDINYILYTARDILDNNKELLDVEKDALRYAYSNINKSDISCRIECATYTIISTLISNYKPNKSSGIMYLNNRLYYEESKKDNDLLLSYIKNILLYLTERGLHGTGYCPID